MDTVLDALPVLPRPAPRHTVIPRVDIAPASRPLEPGWSVETRDEGVAVVRFWHHSATARAVALSASGWFAPEPVSACDFEAVGDGWWTAAFRVGDDWQAAYEVVEYDGDGAPPWHADGLRRVPRLVPGTTDMRAATVPRMIRLVPGRDWLTGYGSAAGDPHRTEPTHAGEPRVRMWRWGSSAAEVPLVVFFDGEAHVERLGTPRLIEQARIAGVLPDLALAFVDAGADRAESLGVPAGQARWVARRLVPRLHSDGVLGPIGRLDTTVTGSSFAGLSAIFAPAAGNGAISGVVAQSVSLWRYPAGDLTAALKAALPQRIRLRLHAGRYEGDGPERSAALATALDGEGRDGEVRDVRCRVVTGGHDWTWWVPEAIEELGSLLSG